FFVSGIRRHVAASPRNPRAIASRALVRPTTRSSPVLTPSRKASAGSGAFAMLRCRHTDRETAPPMATEASRIRSADIAALLYATDDNGQTNPLSYEAERLILHSKSLGGI